MRESISGSAAAKMADLLETHYLTPGLHRSRIESYSKGAGGLEMRWRAVVEVIGMPRIDVHLVIGQEGVAVDFPGPEGQGPERAAARGRIGDEIEVVVTTFLARAKKTSLYFVFSLAGETERMEEEAPKPSGGSVGRDLRKRLFAGNTANLFLTLMLMNFVLAVFLGPYAILAIVAVQFIALFFSDRLVLGTGNVRPDSDRPEVAIVRVASTPETKELLSRTGESLLLPIKEGLERAISSRTVTEPGTKSRIHEILVQHGMNCSPDDVEVTSRNPYRLVKAAAERFELPVPKISIMNTPMDNASATGISHARSSISITAGALEDLDDAQLTSVVGHELGHVKGRDPLIFFGITMIVYLGGFYVWTPILLSLGFFYFIVAFGLTYTVGKFLETRADTQSIIVLGNPDALASALTTIGFSQLFYERYSRPFRIFDWLRFDPHPPIYFRISRLARIGARGEKINHALLVSIGDCVTGFYRALLGMG